MAKFLQKLLIAKEPLFSTTLRQLESMTGNQGVDVAYIADITTRAHEVMRRLGLDPADTTQLELYKALSAHSKNKKLFTKTDDVALIVGNEVISFNYEDVQANVSVAFEQRTFEHMKCQVQHELVLRYTKYDSVNSPHMEEMLAQSGVDTCKMDKYHAAKKHTSTDVLTPKVLCIGDIFTDAFIKLDESYAVVESDKDGKEWLKLPFGSKPPYERVDIIRSVGPSPNAAVSSARLGLEAELMAWLGDDEPGKQSLAHLQSENVGTGTMVTQKGSQSSYWYVLRHGTDRTMLVKSESYNYAWEDPAKQPDWIYLAYIGEDSWPLHEGLEQYLKQNPSVKFVFQPATYHFEWGVKKLSGLYKRAHMVVMNREEAMQVTGKGHEDLHELARGLHNLGPEVVVITDGSHGSYASQGGKLITVPNYPDPALPMDRTGAGDAFASTIMVALSLGKTLEEALSWAPINSMSVVQKLGAQEGLLGREELEKYLSEAPEWYKVEEYKG